MLIKLDDASDPHDAHVELARQTFRECGFTLSAMQYKRPPEALAGLRKYNRVPDNWRNPFAWGYFANAHMRDNWKRYY